MSTAVTERELPNLGQWPEDWQKFEGEWICHDGTGRIIVRGKDSGEALRAGWTLMAEPVLVHCHDVTTLL